MIEGTWRIVEDEGGETSLYLFRPGGGYVWFSLDEEPGIALQPHDGSGPRVHTEMNEAMGKALAAFLRAAQVSGNGEGSK